MHQKYEHPFLYSYGKELEDHDNPAIYRLYADWDKSIKSSPQKKDLRIIEPGNHGIFIHLL